MGVLPSLFSENKSQQLFIIYKTQSGKVQTPESILRPRLLSLKWDRDVSLMLSPKYTSLLFSNILTEERRLTEDFPWRILFLTRGRLKGKKAVIMNIPKLRLSVAPAFNRTRIHSVLLEMAARWSAVFPSWSATFESLLKGTNETKEDEKAGKYVAARNWVNMQTSNNVQSVFTHVGSCPTNYWTKQGDYKRNELSLHRVVWYTNMAANSFFETPIWLPWRHEKTL